MYDKKLNQIEFICEQDGVTERVFKKHLCSIIKQYNLPVRAYLTQVRYSNDNNNFNVALCYVTKNDKIDISLREKSASIFKSIFGSHEHLDIIFISQDQEQKIRIKCCPFYVAPLFQCLKPDFFLYSTEG